CGCTVERQALCRGRKRRIQSDRRAVAATGRVQSVTMSDLGILALCALVGWAVVSWIISVVQQQKRPPLDLTGGSPPPRDQLRGLPSPGTRDQVATPPDISLPPRGPTPV